ncbi:MAG: branched-chain amino acid ABC transporter permease [Candidatus Rokubacteria bacterium]|nr:branched-chain amino acid ABC transporter permease [Candidatus Rokubacteria bacterium]
MLPQQLVFGLALGTVYGLIALGYTMVYGILFMINFAHGDIFMIGAYLGWGVLAALIGAQVGGLHPAWVVPLMLLNAMVVTGLLGVCLERFAYRPLYMRGATRLGPLISAVGASIFLQNAVMLTQGARMKVYMTNLLFPRTWRVQVAGVNISILVLVMIGVAILMMWGLHQLVQRTTLGRSIRAVAEDREMAAIMGVNIRRVIGMTFFLGSALGGAGGVLVGLYYTQIDFFMGYSAGLKAFTAAVLGGIGNIRGAMLGGLLLGIAESLAVTFLNPAFKDVIVFAILILTLVFKPTGLLGESLPDWEKV